MESKSRQKRIRIFAGPNGSGKSTLYEKIRTEYKIRFGYYINADKIFEEFRGRGYVDLSVFQIKTVSTEFAEFYLKSGWDAYIAEKRYLDKWEVNQSIVSIENKLAQAPDAAILADFIRTRLLARGDTFTFETVMSHPSKIDFMKSAERRGYKTYLYFVATEDPAINLNRVHIRILKGGHAVPDKKVISRYKSALGLLLEAIRASYRSYIFDNTNELKLIAEAGPSGKIAILASTVPQWFYEHVIKKVSLT